MPNGKKSIPPRDSWLSLAPGASVQLDARLSQEWGRLREECRRIRGTILAHAFDVEYLLDQLIVETLMPASGPDPPERVLFDELFLKSPGAGFRNKVEVLRKLRAGLPRLREVLPDSVFGQLSRVRQVRNDFAHYPVTFIPTGDPPDQTLRPVLESRRGSFPLDGEFLDECGKTVHAAYATLEEAVKQLRSTSSGSGERA